MDVSGSMGDVADPATGATKLYLAKSATITALGDFNDDDEVGLWPFTTDLGDDQEHNLLPLTAPCRVGDLRVWLPTRIHAPPPPHGHSPYTATQPRSAQRRVCKAVLDKYPTMPTTQPY